MNVKNEAEYKRAWKKYVRLRKESIEIMGALAAYAVDNVSAALSDRAREAIAKFSPTSIKGRVLDLLSEDDEEWAADDVLKALNAQPGQMITTITSVRSCLTELERDSHVVRVKTGVYRAVADEDAEGVVF